MKAKFKMMTVTSGGQLRLVYDKKGIPLDLFKTQKEGHEFAAQNPELFLYKTYSFIPVFTIPETIEEKESEEAGAV